MGRVKRARDGKIQFWLGCQRMMEEAMEIVTGLHALEGATARNMELHLLPRLQGRMTTLEQSRAEESSQWR